MSNTDVKKNFSLSAAFSKYVVNNPDVLDGVPKGACIVFTVKSDPSLSRKNERLAVKVMQTSKTPCYKAEKIGGTWRVMRFSRSGT